MSSPPLRIELRGSNLLRWALGLLAVLAVLALWRSELARASVVIVPVLLGLAWRSLQRLPWRELVLRGDGSAAAIDPAGEAIEVVALELQRRGPLWVLRLKARDRIESLLFGPDTLDSERRRHLRLWMDRHVHAEPGPGIVPHV